MITDRAITRILAEQVPRPHFQRNRSKLARMANRTQSKYHSNSNRTPSKLYPFHAILQVRHQAQAEDARRDPLNPLVIHVRSKRQITIPHLTNRLRHQPKAHQTAAAYIYNQHDVTDYHDDDSRMSCLILYSAAHPTHHPGHLSLTKLMHMQSFRNTANGTESPITD